MSAPVIAVYGATGHTGRLVAAELSAAGHDLLVAGRNADALRALAADLDGSARVRVAALDDPRALRAVTGDAAVVVNCAGPFAESGGPVALAAVASGCHYLDHATEPFHVRHLFDTLDISAREAGSVVVPGMSFYGATGDLLAGLVADGLPRVDTVTVAYAVSGWRMTGGSKRTAQALAGAERLVFADGALRTARGGTRATPFDFPEPVGRRVVLENYPAGEVVTIPRHVPTRAVDVLMTADTFTEEGVFAAEHVGSSVRAGSAFVVVVRVGTADETRVGYVRGRDIYRVGAVAAAEAATRLADGRRPTHGGVLSASEAFGAADLLARLQQRGAFTLSVQSSDARPAARP
ncbi:MAG: saccharopine dehydrogenase NADP-binding domain-containing protein [Actinocatenispora sp.]